MKIPLPSKMRIVEEAISGTRTNQSKSHQGQMSMTHSWEPMPAAMARMLCAVFGSCRTSGIAPGDVTLRGYNKRASDAKETFFITNNTKHRISHVTLLLRYATLTGTMLHERTVTVPVRLRAGESQLVSIKSWDVQRLFYYYAGPKPRKMATPYKVAFRLTGYDIPVGK